MESEVFEESFDEEEEFRFGVGFCEVEERLEFLTGAVVFAEVDAGEAGEVVGVDDDVLEVLGRGMMEEKRGGAVEVWPGFDGVEGGEKVVGSRIESLEEGFGVAQEGVQGGEELVLDGGDFISVEAEGVQKNQFVGAIAEDGFEFGALAGGGQFSGKLEVALCFCGLFGSQGAAEHAVDMDLFSVEAGHHFLGEVEHQINGFAAGFLNSVEVVEEKEGVAGEGGDFDSVGEAVQGVFEVESTVEGAKEGLPVEQVVQVPGVVSVPACLKRCLKKGEIIEVDEGVSYESIAGGAKFFGLGGECEAVLSIRVVKLERSGRKSERFGDDDFFGFVDGEDAAFVGVSALEPFGE